MLDKKEYESYMRSTQWKNIRQLIIKRSGGKCERCGCMPLKLECHHKTYERFKRERLDDLQALCKSCHDIADRERERKQKVKSNQRVYQAGFETFMEKKHGDDWFLNHDELDGYDEFDDWLQSKQDDFY